MALSPEPKRGPSVSAKEQGGAAQQAWHSIVDDGITGPPIVVEAARKGRTPGFSAGGGIRTLEPLRDEVLSLTPLTRLGDPRAGTASLGFAL